MSTPTFLLPTPVEYSEATWKKATKCKKELSYLSQILNLNGKNPSFTKIFLILPEFLHLLRQFDKFFQFFIIFIFRLQCGPVCRNKKYLSIPDLDFGRKKSLFGSDLYRCWMHLPFNWHCFSDHSPQIWTTVSTLLSQALTFLYVAF